MPRRSKKVVRYRKPVHINMGTIVFVIIVIYMVIIMVNYFRHNSISIYEVAEKSISDDNAYRGIILRDETLYYTDKAGYINYYVSSGERIGKSSTVYTIDETGDVYKILTNTDSVTALSGEDSEKIRGSIASFRKNYTNSNYDEVTDFKYEIENTILEQSSASMLAGLNDYMDSSNHGSFEVVSAPKSGIISYTMDGNEELDAKDITENTFKELEENRTQLRSSEAVSEGTPVYKLINSEDWKIIISLTQAQYKKLKDMEKVQVTFKKDNISAIAGISVYKNKESYLAELSLNKYMIRYVNDRFIDIEILTNSAEGLKIPITSILTKDFLLVPEDFITLGGENNSTGVTKETTDENGETKYEFISVTVISRNEEECYIESEGLGEEGYIMNTATDERYQLGKKGTLEGVYNVNKGYAVFRVIEKIYENKEYAIVSKDTSYGLSAYDHIVLNGNSIKESELVK